MEIKKLKNLLTITLSILLFASCTKNEVDYVALNKSLMGQGTGINKVFFIVNDLEVARNFYADTLGFNLPKSNRFRQSNFDGVTTTNTRFPDMSSLEFLEINIDSATNNTPKDWINYTKNFEGIQSYTISTSSTYQTKDWLEKQGFLMDSINSYRTSKTPAKGWSRDDGSNQESSLSFRKANNTYLPKFMQALTSDYKKTTDWWNTYYVYSRSYSKNLNGVVGIRKVILAVEGLKNTSESFEKMGLKKVASTKNYSSFKIKRHQEVELRNASKNEKLKSFLVNRGQGVFALQFDVINIDSTLSFFKKKLSDKAFIFDSIKNKITIESNYAKGVQLEFVEEPTEQALLAKQTSIGGKLDSVAANNAAKNYQKYCALCHAKNREGYAADNAPSLKSESLLASSKSNNFMRYTIQFGRANTAMGGYLDDQGGPLEYIEIEQLLQWLYEQANVEKGVEISRDPVVGNIELGKKVYNNTCAICHGKNGEGISAPALGNPMLLATATDGFLKYAIEKGREGTPMIAYKNILSEEEINGVTAFLRTRASGWNVPKISEIKLPTPKEYVLNANGKNPNFTLRENLYVPAKQVFEALKDSSKMVILDARSKVAWRQMHIPGAVPVPYYEDPEKFVNDLPKDDTWIVVYCACPHAASQRVVSTLKRYGFKNTAIIDEGILVYAQKGYTVVNGQ
ncbi:MAG: c-type cytochrome [Flavobacteriaceae bacterium]|nr:c-type cytochrome [Flavobacteriaceae bacterium]